jgi:para-aminobenzoate synthetase component I
MYEKADRLAKAKEPFLIIIDFKCENILVYRLDELDDIEFSYDKSSTCKEHSISLHVEPISFDDYEKKFDCVIENIKSGNTYLTNLTQPSNIESYSTLQEIYENANAPYKIRYKDQFISFSPEKFIEIIDNKIYTYPMKGTIDASIEDAKTKILENRKEMAEHVMVVDLLRNDLGRVAKDVKVDKFRYIQKIKAGKKDLLQVSSQISAKLPLDWSENFSYILKELLPAGSISGTPKKKTLEIIDEVESYDRGFFSGIWGIFDGKNFKSAVMIRFIENQNGSFIYKSGGGITLDSDAKSEYDEMIQKVYIP